MFNQVFRIFYTVLIIIKRSFLCIMGKILIDQLIQDTLIHYAQTNRENAAFVMSSHLPGAVQICSPCSSGLYTTGNDPRWKAQLHCHQWTYDAVLQVNAVNPRYNTFPIRPEMGGMNHPQLEDILVELLSTMVCCRRRWINPWKMSRKGLSVVWRFPKMGVPPDNLSL